MTDYITNSWRFILMGGLLSLGVLFGANHSVSLVLAVAGVGLALAARSLMTILTQHRAWTRPGLPAVVTACALLVPAGLLLLLWPSPAAQAANLTVTTTVDRIDAGDCADLKAADLGNRGDGQTSLREAICVANNTAGPDQITLPAGTYHLTIRDDSPNVNENANKTGDLDITANLTITGAGARTTIIDAGGTTGLDDRVIHVLNATVNISGITIQHGAARAEPPDLDSEEKNGGGIYVEENGSLALTNSLVMTNTAYGAGGGIYNIGLVALKGVTIYDNRSNGGSGGGIWNDAAFPGRQGVLTGVNVTISDNRAIDNNGFGGGGGIRNVLGTMALTNTTIVENKVLNSSGTNKNAGAGIDSTGPAERVVLVNTIIANNEVVTDDQTFKVNCRGNFDDGGNNLESSAACGFNPASSNVVLELGPLTTDNGGSTPTHALPAGSPAVDAGNDAACLPTDQRGRARVDQPGVGEDDSLCDIGAFEFDRVVRLSLSPTSRSLKEGDNGIVEAVFAVTLSGTINTEVTVKYATADGSATLADNDYIAASGVITFPPGSTTPQNIVVAINSDTKPESNEAFFVELSDSRWAAIDADSGEVTIQNDDVFPEISINNVTVTEVDTGTVEAVFTVTLSKSSPAPVTVNYSTANGTARVNENDYLPASGSLTFDGVTKQTITVFVQGDTDVEADETFFVNLSGVIGARLADSQGLGLILDNERVDVLISDAIVEERDDGETSQAVFEVTLSRTKDVPITVNYQTSEITADDSAHRATAEADYRHTKGVMTFSPTITSHEVIVPVFGDDEDEEDEVFLVTLSKAVEAVIADPEGRGTIVDNDVSFDVYFPILVKQALTKR